MDASVSGARVALLELADPGVGGAKVGLQVDDTPRRRMKRLMPGLVFINS